MLQESGGSGSGQAVLVLEFVSTLPGCGHLADQLKLHGPMDEQTAKLLLRQLLSALHHCHERGVVHRDLKVSC